MAMYGQCIVIAMYGSTLIEDQQSVVKLNKDHLSLNLLLFLFFSLQTIDLLVPSWFGCQELCISN